MEKKYCAYCEVVEVAQEQYLCEACTNAFVEYLAQEYQETVLASEGLY